eukprot:18303-Heterococcus_DN1.PRE.1
MLKRREPQAWSRYATKATCSFTLGLEGQVDFVSLFNSLQSLFNEHLALRGTDHRHQCRIMTRFQCPVLLHSLG